MSNYTGVKQASVFNSFTRKYQLSKTLRFELKPVGKTEEFLKKNKVFEKDKLIDDHYHEIKYYFDALHREFIDNALQNFSFAGEDYQKYIKTLEQLKLAKKEEKKKASQDFQKIEAGLREKIIEQFDETANAWKEKFRVNGIELKQDGVEILFEEAILSVLKIKFSNQPHDDINAPAIAFKDPITDKEKNLFDSFKGFFTYFYNFNETKRNLYSKEEKDTAVANRAVNENLRKFAENVIQFNERKGEYTACEFTKEEQEIFNLTFYNSCFSQSGIDVYNRVVGGFVDELGEKIKGINEKINFYNQAHKDKKLKSFGRLFKQILSKQNKKHRFAEISDDSQVFGTLSEFTVVNDNKMLIARDLMSFFLRDNARFDTNTVYIKGAALNTISQKWFGNWAVIRGLLHAGKGKKKADSSGEENVKLPDFISFAQIQHALERISDPGTGEFISAEDLFRPEYRDLYEKPAGYYETFLKIWEQEWNECMSGYQRAKSEAQAMIRSEKSYRRDNEKQISIIKAYCDAAIAIFQMMKYFALEKGRKPHMPEGGIDNDFYNSFNDYYQDYPVPAYYNEFRNYLTAKPYLGRLLFPAFGNKLEQRHRFSKRRIDGAEKIKLNFENGMLLAGWDKKKEPDYYGLLFRENGKFLLGLMTKEHHDLFKDGSKFIASGQSDFEKMEYRQLNNVFRQLPRIAFADKNRDRYGISKELEEIRDEFREFQTGKRKGNQSRFDPHKIHKLITLYKKVLKDQSKDDFELGGILDVEFDSLNAFFTAVERKTYAIKFLPINRDYVRQMNEEGKLSLFEITNKDFRKMEKSTDNLHTLYFNGLFEKTNLINPQLKLSGGAEIFFRPKNENLRQKEVNGKRVQEHKRYGEDKVFLHIPIMLNMGAGRDFGFNSEVNKLLADKKHKIKIIGVDRGEKHLAYYALIDQEGRLLKCGDLDGRLPNEETYLKKLEDRAGKRDEARKEWKTIENIKDLKAGYISQVVRDLADMMIQEDAILVFEDLSIGFKRGRQKMEQQVYQKLELALVQKLNYLVNKKATPGESGHYLNAFQLTPQVSTPQDIGKQCGAVFFVSPGYTSLTCPECGYRKNMSLVFENISKAKKLIKDLKLCVTADWGGYIIEYTLPSGQKYKVFSNVERLRWHTAGTDYAKNHRRGEEVVKDSQTSGGLTKRYSITNCLKWLFEDKNIGIGSKAIYAADDLIASDKADFYRHLFRYLDLMLRSRNSVSGTATDYIQCPRCLFHSDNGFQGHNYNGDANGAYNIARKGFLALRKIQEAPDPANVRWGNLKIDVEEWDAFTQNQWNPTSKSQR